MYMVTAPVSEHLVTALMPYRQKYDPLAKLIPPHVSILTPFDFSQDLGMLQAHLAEVSEAHAPIKVSVIGWDTLEDRGYQLRLPVMAGRMEFIALYTHLLTGPLEFLTERSRTYEPQIVFGRFARPEELAQAKQAIKGFEPQFVFRATYLELWERAVKVDQPWQIVKQFGLKATVAGRLRRPLK